MLRTHRRIGDDSADELLVTLPPRGTISGLVRSRDGRPADGSHVWMRSIDPVSAIGRWNATGSTEAAEGGRFSFEGLPAGRYELSASVASSKHQHGEAIAILEEGGRVDDVVLTLP